eukprot:TRINITY_DN26940_c0_g1_i9.p2 TRINITY_DN26940_c0_g1~~TRINITY_DN26940_c0_g1_i9.p2  ORF type:complete len:140 (+),score=12.23 TRINITY_DN26940_c0_g1_i9:1163-1582(+)
MVSKRAKEKKKRQKDNKKTSADSTTVSSSTLNPQDVHVPPKLGSAEVVGATAGRVESESESSMVSKTATEKREERLKTAYSINEWRCIDPASERLRGGMSATRGEGFNTMTYLCTFSLTFLLVVQRRHHIVYWSLCLRI